MSSFGGVWDNLITETITYESTSTPPNNLPLRICLIALGSGGANQVNFDNVRLSTVDNECPDPQAPVCGDGVTESPETCDDGVLW
jgi:hypothetical protein